MISDEAENPEPQNNVGPWRRSVTKTKEFASKRATKTKEFASKRATKTKELTFDNIVTTIRGTKRWDPDDLRWVQWWFWRALGLCIVASVMVWVIHSVKIPILNGEPVILKEWLGLTEQAMQTLEVFVSVFGLAYAIVVGLLIVEAHGRFHELSSAFRGELKSISDIHDCLGYFNKCAQAKEKIRLELLRYVGRIKKYEWLLMEQSRAGFKVVQLFMERYPERERKKLWGNYWVETYRQIEPFQVRGMDEIVKAVRKL